MNGSICQSVMIQSKCDKYLTNLITIYWEKIDFQDEATLTVFAWVENWKNMGNLVLIEQMCRWNIINIAICPSDTDICFVTYKLKDVINGAPVGNISDIVENQEVMKY